MKAASCFLAGVLAAATLPGAGIASAESFEAFVSAAPGNGFAESFERALEAERLPVIAIDGSVLSAGEGAPEPPKVRRPQTFWIGVVSAIAIGGSYYNARSDGPQYPFHVTREGWFGQNTYTGGADKASHFVSYYIVGKLLAGVDMELGMSRDSAALLGAGTSVIAGLATELGDGTNKYGFSWEDLLTDSLGAATSLAITHYGLDDLIGFRAGFVPAPTAVCCPYGGTGKDYTAEIYTADLKIAGLGERAKFNSGPARFLLFSVSYGSKGYPYADPLVRERQVGFELGINFGEILRVIGVPPDKWWGKILYFGFDVIRLPYTQVGMYYDLNSGQWHGPGIGDSFPGGGR
jgi:uncharacterized protein YfiM (DUF2279 family)